METKTPLKSWRKASGKTQQEAADFIGVTLPMWNRWETGAREVPPLRARDIEEKTGIPRHVLCPKVYDPPPQSEGAAA